MCVYRNGDSGEYVKINVSVCVYANITIAQTLVCTRGKGKNSKCMSDDVYKMKWRREFKCFPGQ